MNYKEERQKLEIQEKKIELQERKAALKNAQVEISINHFRLSLDVAEALRQSLTSSYLIKQDGEKVEAAAFFEKKEFDEILKKYYEILMNL